MMPFAFRGAHTVPMAFVAIRQPYAVKLPANILSTADYSADAQMSAVDSNKEPNYRRRVKIL